MQSSVSTSAFSQTIRKLPPAEQTIDKIGYWSSFSSLVLALSYSAAQLLSWLKWLRPPTEQFWLFLPSLFLAPAFLLTAIALHYKTFGTSKIWTAIGVAFAVVYCSFATLTYFTQLGSVYPLLKSGRIDDNYAFTFKPGSFTIAIDCLGYFFMSLSTLFTAFAFRERNKGLYIWLLTNGLLIFLLVPAFFYPTLYYYASIWTPVFSLAMIASMREFHHHPMLILTD